MTPLEKLAKKYFNLELPTTLKELKSAYRRESFVHHPDRGGDASKFNNLTKAYEILSSPNITGVINTEDNLPRTEDGTLISSLGLKSSTISQGHVICDSCDGKGVRTVREYGKFIQCQFCQGTGAVARCPECLGVGMTSEGNPTVSTSRLTICKFCHGKKIVSVEGSSGHIWPICPECHGKGGIRLTRSVTVYFKCPDCLGVGEKLVFKPSLNS